MNNDAIQLDANEIISTAQGQVDTASFEEIAVEKSRQLYFDELEAAVDADDDKAIEAVQQMIDEAKQSWIDALNEAYTSYLREHSVSAPVISTSTSTLNKNTRIAWGVEQYEDEDGQTLYEAIVYVLNGNKVEDVISVGFCHTRRYAEKTARDYARAEQSRL